MDYLILLVWKIFFVNSELETFTMLLELKKIGFDLDK